MRSTIPLIAFVGLAFCGHAQTVALFTVDQPAQFLVDAGEQQIYSGVALTLGGQPTATGGGATYTYSWVPTTGLEDPTVANPILTALSATTVFTVSVRDVASGCVKTSAVEVVADGTIGVFELNDRMGRVYPNPTANEVTVEAQEAIAAITLRSVTGQEVMQSAFAAASTAKLYLSEVPDGLYLLTISLASGHQITHKLCKASSAR
jgi:hypothetical protein